MAWGWQNRHWTPAEACTRWLKSIGWAGAARAARWLRRMAPRTPVTTTASSGTIKAGLDRRPLSAAMGRRTHPTFRRVFWEVTNGAPRLTCSQAPETRGRPLDRLKLDPRQSVIRSSEPTFGCHSHHILVRLFTGGNRSGRQMERTNRQSVHRKGRSGPGARGGLPKDPGAPSPVGIRVRPRFGLGWAAMILRRTPPDSRRRETAAGTTIQEDGLLLQLQEAHRQAGRELHNDLGVTRSHVPRLAAGDSGVGGSYECGRVLRALAAQTNAL